MTEPTPLSAEEEAQWRRSAQMLPVYSMTRRWLATLDAARATVPAADNPDRGAPAYRMEAYHPLIVPAADDREDVPMPYTRGGHREVTDR